MPKLKFTDAAIQRLRAPEKGQVDYWDRSLPAFGLRVSAKGTKSWIVMNRVHGRLSRFTVGKYPALSLKDARRKAGDIMDATRDGEDPRDERRRERDRQKDTFDAVRTQFLERYVDRDANRGGLRPSTAAEYHRILTSPDFRAWERKPVHTITRREVIDLLETIVDRGSPIMANRSLAYLRKMFNWAVEQAILPIAPTEGVKTPTRERSRDRILSDAELTEIWQALDAEGSVFAPLAKMLIVTGQRRDEVAGMRWSELHDLNGPKPTWEIPADRVKMDRPHDVPLSSLAVEILGSVDRFKDCDFVFTAQGKVPFNGFSRAKGRLDEAIVDARRKAAKKAGGDPEDVQGLEPWRLHDLRRTLRSGLARLGVRMEVADRVTGHVSGAFAGVRRVYDRYDYAEEKREALQAWAEHLAQHVGTAR